MCHIKASRPQTGFLILPTIWILKTAEKLHRSYSVISTVSFPLFKVSACLSPPQPETHSVLWTVDKQLVLWPSAVASQQVVHACACICECVCVCVWLFELASELCEPAATQNILHCSVSTSVSETMSLYRVLPKYRKQRGVCVCVCVCVRIFVPKLGRKVKR